MPSIDLVASPLFFSRPWPIDLHLQVAPPASASLLKNNRQKLAIAHNAIIIIYHPLEPFLYYIHTQKMAGTTMLLSIVLGVSMCARGVLGGLAACASTDPSQPQLPFPVSMKWAPNATDIMDEHGLYVYIVNERARETSRSSLSTPPPFLLLFHRSCTVL